MITGNIAWRKAEGFDIIAGCTYLWWEEIQNCILTRNNVQREIHNLSCECCRKGNL
jgi:hypothetical protein